ncbi:unnamed protein product [Closterium sp. Naga37s-1]|nr:unnamed protein product [Closterium sp. Naga37s-1]
MGVGCGEWQGGIGVDQGGMCGGGETERGWRHGGQVESGGGVESWVVMSGWGRGGWMRCNRLHMEGVRGEERDERVWKGEGLGVVGSGLHRRMAMERKRQRRVMESVARAVKSMAEKGQPHVHRGR